MNLNAAFETFSAAQVAGQQINADLQAKKDDHEIRQQQLASAKQQLAATAQAQEQAKKFEAQRAGIIADYDSTAAKLRIADGSDPDVQAQQQAGQEVQMYRDIGKAALLTNPAMAEQYFKLADASAGKASEIQKRNLDILDKKVKLGAAFAGSVLSGGVPQEQAYKWVLDNEGVEAAKNYPTDPAKVKLYWEAKRKQGMTATEQVVNEEKVREFEVTSKQKAKDAADAAEDRRMRRAELAASREANAEARKERQEITRERLALSKKGFDLRERSFEEGGTVQHQRNLAAAEYGVEIARNLDNVAAFAASTNGALFQGVPAGTSILGALQGNATNKLTPEGEQILKSAFAGVATEMGQLMTSSGGRGANQTLIHELHDMITYRASDTPMTKLFKLSNAAQLARVRMEATPEPSNPAAKEKRKEALEILKSYPEPKDIIAASAKKGEKIPGQLSPTTREELNKFMRKTAAAPKSNLPADIQDILNLYPPK